MTETAPPGQGGSDAGDALLAAIDAFESFRTELINLLHDVKLGKSARAKQLAPAITDLGRAFGTMVREYDRAEEERARHGTGISEQALDLAAARDEVGRRMARLRAARSAGELSVGARRG
jgi:hypothetical protein